MCGCVGKRRCPGKSPKGAAHRLPVFVRQQVCNLYIFPVPEVCLCVDVWVRGVVRASPQGCRPPSSSFRETASVQFVYISCPRGLLVCGCVGERRCSLSGQVPKGATRRPPSFSFRGATSVQFVYIPCPRGLLVRGCVGERRCSGKPPRVPRAVFQLLRGSKCTICIYSLPPRFTCVWVKGVARASPQGRRAPPTAFQFSRDRECGSGQSMLLQTAPHLLSS